MENNAKQNLKASLKAAQSWWQDMGVDTPAIPATPQAKPAKKSAPKTQSTAKPDMPPTPTLTKQVAHVHALATAAPTLDALKSAIEGFDAGALSDHARNTVFARGNPKASVMAIGEAPGQQEDESGLPFVGPAGQLLDKMFAAINLDENSLYITNICNWRPPNNRNPNEDELAICKPFIMRHIELVKPKFIVIVGGVSLQALTGKTGIMKARGQWETLDAGGVKIPAIPLYHPAFLLRRPELKKYAWRDLLALKEKMS